MAVAVAEAQATITSKTSIGNNRAIYSGSLAFGTEYAAGGDALATNPVSRIVLPGVIESMLITGAAGWDFVYTGTGHVQAFGGAAAAKGVGVEAAAKQDLSGAKAQFWALGPA